MKSINDIINNDNLNESAGWWIQELRRAGAGQYTIKSLTSIDENQSLTVSDLARVLTEVYRDLKKR